MIENGDLVQIVFPLHSNEEEECTGIGLGDLGIIIELTHVIPHEEMSKFIPEDIYEIIAEVLTTDGFKEGAMHVMKFELDKIK